MTWDYLIVGQGLAGSVLAYTMLSNGARVLVIDDPEQPQASQAAAGIYNPFTGRKLVKTWMVDQLFPFLERFYRKMEDDLQVSLLHPMPMLRPFLSVKEQNEWCIKLDDPRFAPYIQQLLTHEEMPSDVKAAYGGLMLKKCGYVDIYTLIKAIQKLLEQRSLLIKERFEIRDLQIGTNGISYRGQKASRVIFCEGPNLLDNKYFKWLPLRPVKGETLQIELSRPLPYILNRGVFLLPLSDSRGVVGATFDNHNLDWECSVEGRQKLENKLKNLSNLAYKVVGQKAGIRPASKDRRPLIGIHPRYEPLGVFNGLGTKGVSLAPYFAMKFCQYLEQGVPLANEVTISRYFWLYYD